MEQLLESLGAYAPLVLSAAKALVVLILGWIIAGLVSSTVRKRILANPDIDDTIGGFVANIIRWVILLVVLIAVLSIFGVEATSLVAILGASTLAIGLALQGTLSDLAAGFMLILFRPYRLGQFVDIAGTTGTVKDLNLFITELSTADNVQIIVPNGKAWGSIIRNFSHHATRRVDLVFGIDYGDDANKAMQVILKQVEADKRVMGEPKPWIRVTNLGDSSVDLTLRVWSTSADYWDVKFHLTQAIKEAFDQEGISIPFPHQVEISK